MRRTFRTVKRNPLTGMNKTEERFAQMLMAQKTNGDILYWGFEELKLKVGKFKCFFTPDFRVLHNDGTMSLIEVKGGHMMDDAIVKFKAASLLYPEFLWLFYQFKNNKWTIRYRSWTDGK